MGKKTIIVTESQLNAVSEISINEPTNLLAPFIYDKVKTHTTSLGDNDAFPPEDGFTFDYKILKERLKDINENIKTFNLESYDEKYLTDRLSKLMTECMEMEKPIRSNLEKVCSNAILRIFSVPQSTVNFDVELVDDVQPEHSFRVKPEPVTKRKFDFDSIDDFNNLGKVIKKRRLINALIQGAAYVYSNNEEYYYDDVNSIDKRLIPLYKEITAINDYLLFIKEEKITDKNPMQSGYVEVELGKGKDKSTITAKALIFPFLFHETIRGFMELFASHGLPDDNEKAMYILKQADFLIAEPWDLRMGVKMWETLIEAGYQNPETLPYFFSDLCEMPVKEFNHVLKEIFAKTKKGKHILKHLTNNAIQELEETYGVPMLQIKDANEALITDSPEEDNVVAENIDNEAQYRLDPDEKGTYKFDKQKDIDWKLLNQTDKYYNDNLSNILGKVKKQDRIDTQGKLVTNDRSKYASSLRNNDIVKDIIQRIKNRNGGKSIYNKEDLKNIIDFDTESLKTFSGKNDEPKIGANQKAIETSFDATKIGQMFSRGNAKLSADILVVNITSALNCPSAKLGLCHIHKKWEADRKKGIPNKHRCYAQKDEHQYSNVIQRNLRNEIIFSLLENDEEFIKLLDHHIENSSFKTNYIRFNESGDFPDQEAVNRCERISEYMYKTHGISCSAYTCRYDLDFTGCKYMVINASNKQTNGCDRFYLAVPDEIWNSLPDVGDEVGYDDKGNPFYKCICNCKQCHFCYKTRGENGESENLKTTVYCKFH